MCDFSPLSDKVSVVLSTLNPCFRLEALAPSGISQIALSNSDLIEGLVVNDEVHQT
jgi:hypothetical protein